MKKLTSLAIVGLLAFAGLSLTGCGGSGDTRTVELEGSSPPPALNQVQMGEYAKEQGSKGRGNP